MDRGGIPVYPGATVKGEATTPSGDETHFNMLLSSPDSVDKVASFYKEKLKLGSSIRAGVTQLIGTTPQGANVIISVAPESGSTKVTIRAILYSSKPKGKGKGG